MPYTQTLLVLGEELLAFIESGVATEEFWFHISDSGDG